MAIAKKSAKNPVVKVNDALHEKIVKLFTRPNGATINDLNEAGFKYSARQALKIAEHRGLKTSVKKPDGELTRYYAKKA
jgi:predicted nucleotidyltransferase component of viral defense system